MIEYLCLAAIVGLMFEACRTRVKLKDALVARLEELRFRKQSADAIHTLAEGVAETGKHTLDMHEALEFMNSQLKMLSDQNAMLQRQVTDLQNK